MHIVYLIHLNRDQFPNKYIGSKSNCRVESGKIIGLDGREYVGSVKDSTYRELVHHTGYTLYILGTFKNYDQALIAERDAHIANDVVASPEFFNKSIATINNYTNPDYASFKHVTTGKRARLPRNHPKVLAGEWVGVTKGTILTEEHRKKLGLPGKLNPFYGKTHSIEQRKIFSETAKRTFKGKPKSNEQRRKMSEARKLWWANHHKNQESRKEKGV